METAALPVLKMMTSSSNPEIAKEAEKSLNSLQEQIRTLNTVSVQQKVLELAHKYAQEYESIRDIPAGEQRTRAPSRV